MYLFLNVVILCSVSSAVGTWTWVEEKNLADDMVKEIADVKNFASLTMSVAKIKKYIEYTVENKKTSVETLYKSTLVAYGWNKTRRGAVLQIEGTKGIRYFGIMYSATGEETTFEIESDDSDGDSEEEQKKIALLEAERKGKVANNVDKTSTTAPSLSATPTSTTAVSPKTVGSKENDMVKSIAFTRRVYGINSAKFRVEHPLVTKIGKVLAAPFTTTWKTVKNAVAAFFFPISFCIKTGMDLSTFLFFTFIIPVIPATCAVLAVGGAVAGIVEGPRAVGREFGNKVEFESPLPVKKRP